MNGADFETANKDVPAELFVPAQREEGAASGVMARPSLSYWQDAWLRKTRQIFVITIRLAKN